MKCQICKKRIVVDICPDCFDKYVDESPFAKCPCGEDVFFVEGIPFTMLGRNHSKCPKVKEVIK